MLGVRQAGATEYRVLDMAHHAALLEIAGKDAEAVMAADPKLKG